MMRLSKPIVFSGLIAILGSCSTEKKDTMEYTSGIYSEFMDTSVSPGTDFHQYVSGKWMQGTEIPADKSSYGVATILHENSQEDVKAIIEEVAEASTSEDEKMVGDLYASYMNMAKRNELGIGPILPELEKIDKINNLKDLSAYFGYANKYGFDSPISLAVFADFKNPEVYALYNWQGD